MYDIYNSSVLFSFILCYCWFINTNIAIIQNKGTILLKFARLFEQFWNILTEKGILIDKRVESQMHLYPCTSFENLNSSKEKAASSIVENSKHYWVTEHQCKAKVFLGTPIIY